MMTDGIVMGGGAGIFQGASHRVVTERALFAMPECAIALLPDAGAMYFLTKVLKKRRGIRLKSVTYLWSLNGVGTWGDKCVLCYDGGTARRA